MVLKQKQRKTDISESKVYFNLLGTMGLDMYSITALSKKTNKAKSVIFKQINTLEDRGFIDRVTIEDRKRGDEKFFSVHRMAIRKAVFDYLNSKAKLKPELKKAILTNKYIPSEILALMSILNSKDYTLNKLIREYFTLGTPKITKCKDKDYILIHRIASEIITSSKTYTEALNKAIPRIKYQFGGEGYK